MLVKEIVCVTSVYSFNSFQLASLKCFSSACFLFLMCLKT